MITERGFQRSRTRSAPNAFTSGSSSAFAVAVTVAPNALANWTARDPTPPAPPWMNTRSRREIENRIRPKLGDIPLRELTAEDLDDAYTEWLNEGLAASTVHRHAAVVLSALTQAGKWGWLDCSPAGKASPPSAKSLHKLVTPTLDQVARLIRAAETADPMMAAAVALAFVTGARRGELCALRWSDVTFEAIDGPEVATVCFERSMSQIGDKLIEKSTKTGRERSVMIDGRSAAILRLHQNWQLDLMTECHSCSLPTAPGEGRYPGTGAG